MDSASLRGIGFLSSIALIVNNITGPGIPTLPNVYAESGWLLPTLCIVVVWALTTSSATMLCEAMEKIPGNRNYRKNLEYSTVVLHYLGERWHKAAELAVLGALQSLNIISVVQAAQVMDNAISAVFGGSCGLNFTPFENHILDVNGTAVPVPGSTRFFTCINTNNMTNGNAWGCHLVMSLGFVVSAGLTLPFAWVDLEDNIIYQNICFCGAFVCWGLWFLFCMVTMANISPSLPAVNTNPQTGRMAGILGAVLFNFGFVTTVPTWVNSKRVAVSTNRSLWSSSLLCLAVFIGLGWGGAVAFPGALRGPVTNTCELQVKDPDYNCASNLIVALSQKPALPQWLRAQPSMETLIRFSVYLFPIFADLSGIPIFAIIIRNNLEQSGMSRWLSVFIGAIMPWLIGLPLLWMPNIVSQFLNYISLLAVGFSDFLIPMLVYIRLLQHGSGERSVEISLAADVTPKDSDSVLPTVWRPHEAFPAYLGCTGRIKTCFAATMATVLLMSSFVAFGVDVAQGSYSFDAQSCATAGA